MGYNMNIRMLLFPSFFREVFHMKRFLSLFLAALMLCAFAACRSPAPETDLPALTEEAASPTEAPAPTPLPQGETTSLIAGSFVSDEKGERWTSLAPMDGFSWVYDALDGDVGHVYSFLVYDGTIYAGTKSDPFSMDDIRILACDTATGETTVLAEDAMGNSTFCLLGENILLYMTAEGLHTLDLTTRERSEPLTGATNLLAARNGSFYYTREDGGLYRNNSSLLAEEKLLDLCPSYWLCPGEDSLCTLAYTEEDSVTTAEFRNMDGTLRTRQPLNELPMGICFDGEAVYVPQDGETSIRVYDIADGTLIRTVSLPEDTENCLPLLAQGETIWYQALTEGSFRIFRLGPEDAQPVELAADILF